MPAASESDSADEIECGVPFLSRTTGFPQAARSTIVSDSGINGLGCVEPSIKRRLCCRSSSSPQAPPARSFGDQVPATSSETEAGVVDFVDFHLVDRIVGVGNYHPQARTRSALLNHEERAPPAVVQGAAPGFRMARKKQNPFEM